MKPVQFIYEYVKKTYENDLDCLRNNKSQSKIDIDYTLFNNAFYNQFSIDFFKFNNYAGILNNVEEKINDDYKHNAKNWISLKIVDVPPNVVLHDLDASYNGDVISAKAMVKNITKIQADFKTAVYECKSCFRTYYVRVAEKDEVTMPTLCSECRGRSFRPNYELSEFRNFRYVKLEEPLELRAGGSTREFKGYMQDYLASPNHNLKAGDVVDIIGKFKIKKTKKNNNDTDFDFLIDLHNINPVNNAFEDYRLTEDDITDIKQLSQDVNIYERLVNSIAPEIVSYETVKEGLLLQLFEGYRPEFDVFKNDVVDRWTTHILIIGDPGIGKSQLISALKKRTPKIIIIDGSDTSKAGLTTSAVKDELTGSWTLEAGAVVLADTGLLCIDEFDKLSKSTQKSLNKPMEQLSVSPAKAGLVQTMTARTSVLAIANPKYSRFNPYKSIKEQINIPESTLSRFDLVFALNDSIDESKDSKLALNLLNRTEMFNKDNLIDDELFKKYVTYAKLEIFPVLNDEAKQKLVDFYVQTRQSIKNDDSAKPITVRDLKALERLTIARAKVELREEATVEDVECAIRIYTEALKTIGLTPETAGVLENVVSDAEIKLINETENMIKARMKFHNVNYVTVDVLNDVKYEVGIKCYDLGFKSEDILDTAVKNIENGGLH